MLVLDENLDDKRVRVPLQARLKSRVISVRDLRPGTVIKDDAIPSLLRMHRGATFVTLNVIDFWRRVTPDCLFCIVCVPLTTERQDELPGLLLRLFRHEDFNTTRKRMGKVARVSNSELVFYSFEHRVPVKVSWS